MQVDIHTKITNLVIKHLEEIQIQKQNNAFKNTWSCPWSATENSGLPLNAATKKSYSGVNVLVLWMNAAANGYQSHAYLTFKQAKKLGGNVRKGEKGTHIIKLITFTRENDEGEQVKSGAALRTYTVFNVDQCEGLNIELPKLPEIGSLDTEFNQFLSDTGANINYGGNKACYISATDKIKMPQEKDFIAVIYGLSNGLARAAWLI